MASVARFVDHTLLKPESTRADVEALVAEADELGAYSVCVSPSMLPLTVPDELKVAVVCGFPSGQHTTAMKVAEARESVDLGADEVDLVLNIGCVKAGHLDEAEAQIRSVREVIPAPGLLKVIIESAVLTDAEIVAACEAAVRAGADFVKTSTGFHPAGGASEAAVRLMARTVAGRAEVKASGGIRNLAAARAMLEGGATRLGLSSTAAIVAEEQAEAAKV
jgi:deoxyribose-phosphate aldolase